MGIYIFFLQQRSTCSCLTSFLQYFHAKSSILKGFCFSQLLDCQTTLQIFSLYLFEVSYLQVMKTPPFSSSLCQFLVGCLVGLVYCFVCPVFCLFVCFLLWLLLLFTYLGNVLKGKSPYFFRNLTNHTGRWCFPQLPNTSEGYNRKLSFFCFIHRLL